MNWKGCEVVVAYLELISQHVWRDWGRPRYPCHDRYLPDRTPGHTSLTHKMPSIEMC